ncbi:hypothetical protein ACCO45_004612, partial [Purpureocillium lilacinum]
SNGLKRQTQNHLRRLLCGSVRYTITVPPDHDFDDAIGTCQCSWCRKVTGSLMFRFHQFKKVDVAWDADSTLRTYQAEPDNHRGFCCNCGSYMFFRREKSKLINLAVGCFDDDDLRKYGPLLTKEGATCGAGTRFLASRITLRARNMTRSLRIEAAASWALG